MGKHNSTGTMILINIRRGLCNKRFWIVVGVTTIIYAVIIVLECWFPVQKYYRGYNTPDWYLDGLAALGSSMVIKFCNWNCSIIYSHLWGLLHLLM